MVLTSLCDFGYTVYLKVFTVTPVASFLFLSPVVLAVSMVRHTLIAQFLVVK